MIINKKTALASLLIFLSGYPTLGKYPGPDRSLIVEKQMDSIRLFKDSAKYYLTLGDYRKSLSYSQKSHTITLRIHEPNSTEIANSLINLANIYSLIWEYDTALHIIKRAEEIYLNSKHANKAYLGYIYSSMGRIYKTLGDYFHAAEYYRYAYRFLHYETQQPFISWEALLYNRNAFLNTSLNQYSESLKNLELAFNVIRKVTDNSNLLTMYYINAANTYAKMNLLNKSIDLQLKAIQLCQRDSSAYTYKLIVLYNNIGLDYLELGQFDAAEEYFNKGITIQKSISQKSESYAELHESLANLYQRKQEYKKALRYYQQALEIITINFSPDDLLLNPDKYQIFNKLLTLNILKAKSGCLDNLYNLEGEPAYLDAALNASMLQIELIEDMRNNYQSFEAKLQIAEHESHTYKTSLYLANKAFQKTGDVKYSKLAFEISEKSKSSVLLSSMRELDAREFGGIPENLLIREKKILKEIAFYKENIYEEKQVHEPDVKKIKTWEAYLFESQREQEKLVKQYEREYPNYFALKYNNSVISPGKLQQQLSRNVTVLEYSILEDMLHVFVISKHDFQLLSIAIDSNFFQLVNDYLNEYRNFDFSKQSYNSFTEFCWNSKSLYDVLILPVKDFLKCENLQIIPDGILSFLPFETLIKDIPDSLSNEYFKDADYLLYDYNISYSYSSTLFSELNKKSLPRRIKKLLAIAPEYDTDVLTSMKKPWLITRQKKYRKDLYPIPGVIDEVNAIRNLIPSDVFIGKDATETNFRNIAENYDILHLAMHTVIDNENPMFSKLIFTLGGDSLNDGLLNTYEIFSLKLNARMVVLSACSTGEGNYNQGEGVISLARSFAYAGSPSMLMTLWEVEDRSGVELMKYFYANLKKGQTKPEALRNSKIQFIKEAKPENSHPFFWSAYITMGNTKPLFTNKRSLMISLLFSGAAIVIFLLILRYRNRKPASNPS